MQRSETSFTYGTVNLLTQAANMARKWAERERNFEMCKTTAQITSVSLTSGALLSSMVARGTTTPLAVKSINKAFLSLSGGIGEFPISMISRETHVERLARHFDQVRNVSDTSKMCNRTNLMNYFTLVRHGDYIYITPADPVALGGDNVIVYFDVVKWLPDYVADGDTDFLLTYCEDFMLFKTVQMLNFMIKEDQRVPISDKMLAESYKSVVSWDSTMIANTVDDVNLD